MMDGQPRAIVAQREQSCDSGGPCRADTWPALGTRGRSHRLWGRQVGRSVSGDCRCRPSLPTPPVASRKAATTTVQCSSAFPAPRCIHVTIHPLSLAAAPFGPHSPSMVLYNCGNCKRRSASPCSRPAVPHWDLHIRAESCFPYPNVFSNTIFFFVSPLLSLLQFCV